MYALRIASHADFDFLYRLYIASMKEYVEKTWGWNETFQDELFKNHFDVSKYQIIIHNNDDVGMLSVEDKEEEIFLARIQILPEFQRRGIGRAIITDLINFSKEKNLSLSLRVLRVNPAKQLYDRLGFVVTGETETHYLMKFGSEA